jgi:hypothetical protein
MCSGYGCRRSFERDRHCDDRLLRSEAICPHRQDETKTDALSEVLPVLADCFVDFSKDYNQKCIKLLAMTGVF